MMPLGFGNRSGFVDEFQSGCEIGEGVHLLQMVRRYGLPAGQLLEQGSDFVCRERRNAAAAGNTALGNQFIVHVSLPLYYPASDFRLPLRNAGRRPGRRSHMY